MRRPLDLACRALVLVVAACLAGSAAAASSSAVERFYPVRPVDGTVLGARPVFEIGYETSGEIDPRDLILRIILEPATRDGAGYEFDGRTQRSGWLPGEPGRLLYRPRQPVNDGEYRWRIWLWDGVRWDAGLETFRLRIDTVPPAEVQDLTVRLDPSSPGLILEWDPLTLDRDGRPEFVARYHVYRYEKRSGFPTARLYEIGKSETPRFVDSDPVTEGPDVRFYKVVAEDEAGNQPGRRR